MKLSNQQILDLHQGLNATGNLEGARFSYAVARNIALLRAEVEALQKAYTPSSDFLQYNQERVELAKSHAVKIDGKEQTTIEDGMEKYVIADQAKFDEELTALQGKYQEAIDKRQKQLDDFSSLLKEETEVSLYTIPFEYVPENITAAVVSAILPIIAEPAVEANTAN